jgi:hypothetical protein
MKHFCRAAGAALPALLHNRNGPPTSATSPALLEPPSNNPLG